MIEGEKEKRKRRKKNLLSTRRPRRLRVARAPSPRLPAGRPRTVAALTRGRFFSRARRQNVSPHREKDRGDWQRRAATAAAKSSDSGSEEQQQRQMSMTESRERLGLRKLRAGGGKLISVC
ncbi:hypothetical protein GW17_00009625 [Ensete ventricosum]|nr:hypothetical protein GW17_00009625 [Ensete ventricosum]